MVVLNEVAGPVGELPTTCSSASSSANRCGRRWCSMTGQITGSAAGRLPEPGIANDQAVLGHDGASPSGRVSDVPMEGNGRDAGGVHAADQGDDLQPMRSRLGNRVSSSSLSRSWRGPDQVIFAHHAEVAVSRFGWMQKEGWGAGAGEGGCHVAADDAGLADAGDDEAAAVSPPVRSRMVCRWRGWLRPDHRPAHGTGRWRRARRQGAARTCRSGHDNGFTGGRSG